MIKVELKEVSNLNYYLVKQLSELKNKIDYTTLFCMENIEDEYSILKYLESVSFDLNKVLEAKEDYKLFKEMHPQIKFTIGKEEDI